MRADPTRISVTVQPGGYREHISMILALSQRGMIVAAELRIRELWLMGPPAGVNPLARDLSTSFIEALTPQTDRAHVEQIVDTIRAFRIDAANKARLTSPEFVASPAGQALQAYANIGEGELVLPMGGSVLSITTKSNADEPWRSMRIDCI